MQPHGEFPTDERSLGWSGPTPASRFQALALLHRARALIATGGWCQRAEARDRDGRPRHPMAPNAVAWSCTGAIYRACAFDGTAESRRTYQDAVSLFAVAAESPLMLWNDAPERSRADVLGAFERVTGVTAALANAGNSADDDPAGAGPGATGWPG